MTAYLNKKEMWIGTGCFLGTAKDFMAQVKKVHGDNGHAKDYAAAVEFAKRRLR